MPTIIQGAVKVLDLPDISCFTNIQEWAQALANNLVVEIDNNALSGVVVSVSQPDASDVDKLWIRRSNSGTIIGGYVYSGGKWVQLFPAPNQIFWLGPSSDYPNSATPPPGYQFIQSGDGTFTTDQYTRLISNAILDTNNVDYVYYPARFVGV